MAEFEGFLSVGLCVWSKLKSWVLCFFSVGEAAGSGVRGCSRRKSGVCEDGKSCPAALSQRDSCINQSVFQMLRSN